MGDLAALELARDLENEWQELDSGISLHGYMLLSEQEYAVYATRRVLPRDFERRHGDD